jgi:hypothetical protein
MFKNQFSIIVYYRIILYLCTSTPKYFIYYFVYPNQWSLGDIFAKYSVCYWFWLCYLGNWAGPAYFHMHDRLRKHVENACVWMPHGLLAVCFCHAYMDSLYDAEWKVVNKNFPGEGKLSKQVAIYIIINAILSTACIVYLENVILLD